MAATGKTPILLYGSTTATNTPSAGNLTNSSDGCEIAINVADKNLFFKDATNTVNTVPIRQSSASSNGWLSSTDWNTFNNKQPAGTYVTSVTGTAPVVSSGGTTPAISMPAATGSVNGYLTSTDWTTFNSKQPAGSYALTTDTLAQFASTTSAQLAGVISDETGTGSLVFANTPTLTTPVINGFTGDTSLINVGSGQFYKDTSGNFSFGKTSTYARLSLWNDGDGTTSNYSQLHLSTTNAAVSATNGARLTFNAGNGSAIAAKIEALRDGYDTFNIANGYTGPITFGNSSGEIMRLFGSKGVSIGNTTDPGATNLSVNGTTYCNTFQNRSSQAVYLNSTSSSTDTYSNSVSHVLGNSFTYNQYIQFGGLGGPGLRTDSNYAYCLAPSSTGQWYFVSQTNGVYLNTGATAWASASDLRLKDVTGTYTNALADIAKLEPIKFTWKDDASKKPCVGVSAQSVLPVVPEAVDESVRPDSKDAEAYYSVRYTELIPLLIASIQELQAKLKAAGVAGF